MGSCLDGGDNRYIEGIRLDNLNTFFWNQMGDTEPPPPTPPYVQYIIPQNFPVFFKYKSALFPTESVMYIFGGEAGNQYWRANFTADAQWESYCYDPLNIGTQYAFFAASVQISETFGVVAGGLNTGAASLGKTYGILFSELPGDTAQVFEYALMPVPMKAGHSMFFSYRNAKVYLIGGVDNANQVLGTVQELDLIDPIEPIPITSWSVKTSCPEPRAYFGSFEWLDGTIVIVGGRNNIGPTAGVDCYSPSLDEWRNYVDDPNA